MIRELLAVGCGGAAGSIVRYLLSGGIMAGQTLLGFPAGTFTVNAAGSSADRHSARSYQLRDTRMAAHRGFLRRVHHFFRPFSADAVRLLRAECYTAAAAYVGLSVAVCIVLQPPACG